MNKSFSRVLIEMVLVLLAAGTIAVIVGREAAKNDELFMLLLMAQ